MCFNSGDQARQCQNCKPLSGLTLPAEQITVKEAHPQNVSWDIASVTHLPVLRYSGGVKAKLVL